MAVEQSLNKNKLLNIVDKKSTKNNIAFSKSCLNFNNHIVQMMRIASQFGVGKVAHCFSYCFFPK